MPTTSDLLDAILPLVADLSRELPEPERYRRLLGAMRDLLPCDAAALLRIEGEHLVPLAIDGLTSDTLGRRFRIAEHPRFAALLAQSGPTRFPADTDMPDPYDGLVEAVAGGLHVHDCMGCPLHVDGAPWGLLTLDALQAGAFAPAHVDALRAFGDLAAATVAAARRMDSLAVQAEDERRRAEAYRMGSAPAGVRRMVGQSPALRRLVRDIGIVAPSELTVLVTGETGVGKELVAQALHAGSARADRPLVSVNCAALPEALVESELFGHVRGAFTGASQDRRGRFELADGGTLFLDEVGELPLPAQATLLRVLQSGQVQRVGSDREHRVDVRVIAATNRDLAEEVRAGRMRADFYHRISVYPLRVPPLRERGRDVLALAGAFLEENRSRLGLGGLRLDASAQAALCAYDWPGNVRELEHLIGRSVLRALARHQPRPRILTLTAEDLGLPATDLAAPTLAVPADATAVGQAAGRALREALDDYTRRLVQAALERHHGNRAAAARELGLDRANLARLLRRLGLATAPASAARRTRASSKA